MEECDSLDSEMTELQEFQYEASDVMSQDDEDEVEELRNSLREAVQDQSVKPKLQCLMVDPSFSMVTVQSEDSGIVWETASSRCSTPWASETSSTSEAYSMEGSGGAGKITIVFDEEKVVRRRMRSGGRSSRLGDRLSRPGSSRSASALGVERPEMAEVSLPNVKQEKTKSEADLEEIKTKDQQLFSLISEGYEILNIRVPSKLPTVDEEESTELQDNLSYLNQTPKIRSRIYQDLAQEKTPNLPEEIPYHSETSKQDSSQPSGETQLGDTPTQKENSSDIDYFEKFTLLDVVVPAEQASEPQEEAKKPVAKPQTEEPKLGKEVAAHSPSVSEDSFVFVTDVDIVGEHLDEVFYGEGPPADALQQRGEDSEEVEARMRGRRESQRSTKESGSVLFESEETILTPIFISPGPPKIIDLILLEEPTAMSFMYSDLYEDAVGERRKSDEEYSEAESMASAKSYRRRLSDSEETDGYLEKFTLKDETPTMDVKDESVKDKSEGRMMWSQSKFEMTGCLTRVAEEEDKEKTEEPKTQEPGTEKDSLSTITEEKRDIVTKTEEEKEEIQISTVAQEQTAREVSEDSIKDPELMKKLMEVEQAKHEVKTDQLESSESSLKMAKIETDEPKMQEASNDEDCQAAITEKERDVVTKTEEKEEIQFSTVSDDEQAARKASEDSTQELKSVNILMEVEQVKHEVKTDQLESSESSLKMAKIETDEPKMQEASNEKDYHAAITEKESDVVTKTEEKEEIQFSTVSDEQAAREASEDSTQNLKSVNILMEVEQVKHEVKTDQLESSESSLKMAKIKTDEPNMQEASNEEDYHAAITEKEREVVTKTEEKKEEIQFSMVSDEQAAREASEDSTQNLKSVNILMEVEQVKHEVKTDQLESSESSLKMAKIETDEPKMQEASNDEDCQAAITEKEREVVTKTEEKKEEIQFSTVSDDEQAAREASEDSTQELKSVNILMEVEQVKHEVKTDELEPPEPSLEMAKTKAEEPKMQEAGNEEDCQSAKNLKKKEVVTETEEETKEIQLSMVYDEQAGGEASEDLTQETKMVEEQMEVQQVIHKVETDHTVPELSPEKPPETQQMDIIAEETHASMDHQRGDKNICEESGVDTEKPCESQMVAEKMSPPLVVTTDTTALILPVSTEELPESTESDTKTEDIERILSEVDAADSKVVAADEKLVTEAKTEASAQAKEAESVLFSSNEPLVEMEKAKEASLSEVKEAGPEDVAPVEIFTDCDYAVQTVVEVTETAVNENEIQTQVKIDLQEVTSVEATDAQTQVPKQETETESNTEESAGEATLPTTEAKVADLEPEGEMEISAEVIKSVMPEDVSTESAKKHQKILEIEQQQLELNDETKCESEKSKLMSEANSEMPAEDTKTCVEDMVNVDDGLILLVPKGQAVEMDIEISKWSENTAEDTVPTPDNTLDFQALEPETEVEPEIAAKEEELPRNILDREYSPPVLVEEANTEEQKMVFEEGKITISPLRSFTPLEDLTGLPREDVEPADTDAEQKAEVHELKDAPETSILTEDTAPYVDLGSEDVGQKKEQDEEVLEAPEVPVDELGYEVISKQDAKDMPESETQRDAEGSHQNQEVEMEIEVETDQKVDLVAEEELNEADYEIIDAEEESQALLAAELEGMDWFCITCGCLLSEGEYKSAEHQGHEVNSVDKAYEEIKDALGSWISELQARSENIEDLVSELELAYNSVEDQYMQSEAAMQAQNEEMMALVMEQYNNMSVNMEEEKKAKLEQLYDKIVSFQENIDSAKTTLETTVREAETDARSPEDIHARLKGALDSVVSLELGPKGLLVFEDYAKANTSSSNLTQRKGIPVPQRPTLQPQESGSATSTSVTVYWKVNPGDIIDCFQVYCMEDPQGAVTEEYRVTVKESYCVLEDLEPDKMYKVWVMAVNYTGCSLPSERLVFRTAPSVPTIDTERCSVMWDSATLRWSSTKESPGQTYTLEYCRQYELEGEGLRSISGIKVCEQRVLLQPNENYLFYIKAVNEAGASEQSEAALISTKGTRFHLLKDSAHPALELSEDQTTLHCSQDVHNNIAPTDEVCPSILGDLLPARGLYYWETDVSRSTAYRLGVTYSTANKNSSLGENSSSWCLQCIPTESGYQLLHNDIQSSVCVIEIPERVGTLLDYQIGLLSFYNAQSGQLLGSFRQHFTQPCHPALVLEQPGSLQLCLVLEVPEFTKDS